MSGPHEPARDPHDRSPRERAGAPGRGGSSATLMVLLALAAITLVQGALDGDWAAIVGGIAFAAAVPFVVLADRAAAGQSIPAPLPAALRSARALWMVAGGLAILGLLTGFVR